MARYFQNRRRGASRVLAVASSALLLVSLMAPLSIATASVEPTSTPEPIESPVSPVVEVTAEPVLVPEESLEQAPVGGESGPPFVADPQVLGAASTTVSGTQVTETESVGTEELQCRVLQANGAGAWRSLLNASVSGGVATFTIPEDACDLELTFSVYTWPEDVIPNLNTGAPYDVQIHLASVTGVYGPGTHQVEVPMPECGYYQTDLYLGPPIYQLLSYGHPYDKIIAWDLGGEPCPEPVPADITVVKFNDLDESGTFDEGEPFVEGVEITIEAGEFSDSGLTDATGTVVFSDLYEGAYTVDEIVPQGWFPTVELPIQVELAEGQDQTVYIGNAEEPLPFTFVDLAIEKQADVTTATAGDLITYTVTYRNMGNIAATGFTITDDFDEALVQVTDASGGTVVDGTIVWQLAGPLAPEDTDQQIVYTVRVNDPLPADVTTIDNIVVIAHPADENRENDSDDATVHADPYLPFTPVIDPDPDPAVPATAPAAAADPDDPYLPYTGGDGLQLAAIAAIGLFGGLALRRLAMES